MSYYSQNDEERFILEFFGNHTGRFLDVGAFDGVDMSNTRRLLERGWSGVLVEPMWRNFEALRQNCLAYTHHVMLVLAAVSSTRKLTNLWVDDTPDRKWSTTINLGLLEFGSVIKPNPMQTLVPAITMDELWPLGPFDFISLDAEWEDFDILLSQPRAAWATAKLISIEPRSLDQRANMKNIFEGWNFRVVYETPENLLVAS